MRLTKKTNPFVAMTPLLTAVLLLTAVGAAQPILAADKGIYKSINQDGSVVFTDKRQSNSVSVKSKTFIPQPGKKPILDTSIRSEKFSSDTLGGKDKRKINISALQITSPSNNETVINPEGQIMFTIAMGPDATLPQGYTTEILMNGKPVSNDDGNQISVPVPENGRHEFEARIVSSNGVLLVKSQSVQIDVQTN